MNKIKSIETTINNVSSSSESLFLLDAISSEQMFAKKAGLHATKLGRDQLKNVEENCSLQMGASRKDLARLVRFNGKIISFY